MINFNIFVGKAKTVGKVTEGKVVRRRNLQGTKCLITKYKIVLILWFVLLLVIIVKLLVSEFRVYASGKIKCFVLETVV